MFCSMEEQYSRTRRTTISFICVTGGRSNETPRYLAGITESTPRSRALATIRERQSQGRATSSGPRIQPDPSQMPSRHGCRSPESTELTSECLRVRRVQVGVADVPEGRSLSGRLLDRLLLAGPVGEPGIVVEEDEPDGPDRAVAVLGEVQLGPARVLGVGVVVIVAVEEADQIRVLLDGAGFAKVREDRALVRALLRSARELRDADHRDAQLAGEDLQTPAELGDL